MTGCGRYTPAPGPGGGGVEPPPPPEPIEQISPSDIAINPGIFKGRAGNGKQVRLRVKRDGRNYSIQDITGKNHPPRLYVDQGNNKYRYVRGEKVYRAQVQNSRQFVWSGTGWGTITMND